MKISTNISYKEATRSNTASRLNMPNSPTEEVKEVMVNTAFKVFEPLRKWVGGPVKVNSFFRSVPLNKVIGGSDNSQHCKGQAIDIDDTFGFKTNAEMFYHIVNELEFDQVIWEFGDDENPDWVHVSYVNPEVNRKRALRAIRVNGRTQYVTL